MGGIRNAVKWIGERGRAGVKRWSGFMERQGFYVMLGVCVAVIIGTAVWTRTGAPPVVPPEDVLPDGAEAGSEAEFVQRLSDVTWTSDLPNIQFAQSGEANPGVAAQNSLDKPAFAWPVQGDVLRAHSADAPVFLPTMSAWSTHEGIDIAAAAGDSVVAALSGTVSAAYNDPLLGNVIEVQHPGGFVSRYAGLSTLSLLRIGDPVKTGQLLSPLDKPMALESEDPSHLHFELLRDGEWVDPQEYLQLD